MLLRQAYRTHFRVRDIDYAAYFVFYDPLTRLRLSQRDYDLNLTQRRPQIPPGHPTGYAYDEVIEVCTGTY